MITANSYVKYYYNCMAKFVTTAGALGILSLWVQASNPYAPGWDDGYRDYQEIAPEYVEVEIQEVKKRDLQTLWFASSNRDVYIQAKVLKVIRTEAGLRPGHLIPILYKRKVAAGLSIGDEPVPPPVGEIVPAFLKYEGDGIFVPAALHHTFSSLAPEQKDAYEAKLLAERESAAQTNQPTAEFEQDIPELETMPPETPNLPEGVEPSEDVILVETGPVIKEVGPAPAIEPTVADALEVEAEPELAATSTPEEPIAVPAPIEPGLTVEEPAIVQTEPAAAPVAPSTDPGSGPSFKGILTLSDTEYGPPASPPRTEPAPEIALVEPDPPVIEITETATPAPEEIIATGPENSAAMSSEPTAPDLVLTEDSATIVVETEPVIQEVVAPAPATDEVENVETDLAVNLAETEETVEVTTSGKGPSIADFDSSDFAANTVVASESSPEPSDGDVTVVPEEGSENQDPIELTAPGGAEAAPTVAVEVTSPDATDNATSAVAETSSEPMQRYADIFLQVRNAERLITSSKFQEAVPLLQEALDKLNSLREDYPDFQPFMVEYRQRTTERALKEISSQSTATPAPAETPQP